ncbi:Origin recognition complex subunit 3 [Armadillidium nasatum]|uniref:Origin recognition complex subunit 3 n=1 Tax=Armadillidium nasatum TaxID=96803 RepID=A0A5N5SU36_9CRUS|nr:Origin recognition complex subunit 3 [Armadillidium nasatum]
MSTVSLSKGVFTFKKPKSKNRSKDLILKHWKQEDSCKEKRILTYENYNNCLSLTNQVIEDLQNDTHSKVFKDMIEYIKRVGYNKCRSLFEETSTSKDIPAACLVTGVNMPDHNTLFDNLTSVIKETVSPHIARLAPSDMQQLKTTIVKLVNSLINKDEDMFTSDSETDDIIIGPKKKLHCSEMEMKQSGLSPVVLIFQDIESIPIEILQDIILIASEYQNSIPFVFVFGVSTTPSYIHRHLSQEASSFITMETFQAQPSSSLLSDVIDKLLLSPSIPLHVGGKVFKLLMDIFLFHDLTLFQNPWWNLKVGIQFSCSLIKVLHCFVSSLPGMPLGRQVRELFSLCLSQQVTEMEEFQNAWKLFAMSSKPELLPKLEKSIVLLEEEIMNYIEKEKPSSPVLDLKPSDRFNLREKLLGHHKSKMPKTHFEELRTEILTFFEHIFISHLKPFHTKLFHEVFFFDAIGSVKYQLLGSVRATVQTGLTNPQKYLQCDCCKLNEKDSLVTSLPDLSLCYKLHLECGKYINLFDWLQAFIAVVNGDEEEPPGGIFTDI